MTKEITAVSTASFFSQVVYCLIQRIKSVWSIQEMVKFLDPGFPKMKQEEFDGNIKDRIKLTYVIKRHLKIGILLCG